MAEKVLGFKISIEGLAGTIETAEQLKRAIASLNAELKKTSDVEQIKKLEKQMIDLKAAQMEVTKITREQVKARNEEITATDKANGAYRKLSKELNDTRNRYKDLAASEQDSSEEAIQLLESIRKLDSQLKGIDARVGQFQRNVGGYTESLSQFFPRLGGQLGNVTGAIGGLSSGISALGKTTGAVNVSLGAIGIALTAFSAISEIFAGINETVAETKKLSAQVENFTQVTGSTLESFVAQSKAIATTYTKDVNEIVVSANTASKELGISFPEALNLIEVGFRKGADAQGEFLDGLREYPAQFRDAGLSAKDFIAVSIAAANEGIYSDKGLDVVKEFSLRIREQTKASRDALNNAFGAQFTTELFNNLNNGSISAGEALTKVTGKINDTGVAGSELQTVIADVFGGPGEDVGQRFLVTLGEILNSTDDITRSTTEYQTQQELIYKSNLALEESQANFNEVLIKTGGEFTLISNASKTFFFDILAGLAELVNEFPATFKAMSAGFTTFFQTGSISKALKANRDVFRKEIDIIKKEDKEALEKEEKLKLATEEKTAKDKSARENERRRKEKEIANKAGKENAESFVNGSLAKLQQDQGKLQKAFGEAVVGSDAQKAIAVQLTAANEAIKKAVDEQNEILGLNAEKKKQDAINEINQNATLAKSFVELARSKVIANGDELINLQNRRVALDEDYQKEVTRINNLIALEKEGTKEFKDLIVLRNNLEAQNTASKNSLVTEEKNINDKRISEQKRFKNLVKNLDINSIKDEKDRQIALAKDKLATDLENLENDLEFIKQSELEKARLRKLLTNKIEEEIIQIRKKGEEDEKEKRKKLIEAIINGVSEVINLISSIQQAANIKEAEFITQQIETTEKNIEELEAKAENSSGIRRKRIEKDILTQKELLKQQNIEAEALRIKNAKEEKRIAIIQAIIQGALGVTRALSTAPIPINYINAAAVGIATTAQIATIAAQPLAEGGLVSGQRINQKQNIPTRSNGDNVLAFVKRGEVVLNQRQQSLLGGSETFRRIGIKGFAQGGLVPPISAPIGVNSFNNDITGFLQTIDAKTDAINSRIDRLQAYVVSDDIARDLQEGNKLKVNATL